MTKLKHFAFSFALAGALAFGMGTVTKAAEPASGTTITAPAAKTDISQSKDLSINWKDTSKEYLFDGKVIEPEVIVTQTITENGTTKTVTWTKDTDYTVKYTNNNKVSSKVNEAAAIITPIGEKANSYSGSKTLNFTIKQDISRADSGITASFKDAKTTYTYTAPANTPEVNVEEKTNIETIIAISLTIVLYIFLLVCLSIFTSNYLMLFVYSFYILLLDVQISLLFLYQFFLLSSLLV